MVQVADRKFVIFDAAQIDVNQIVALAYQLKEINTIDKDGKPIVARVQVAVVMLESGSSVTLGENSLEKFEHWWKANVKSEKVDLPAVVEAPAPVPPVAPAPVAEAKPSPPTPATPPSATSPVPPPTTLTTENPNTA